MQICKCDMLNPLTVTCFYMCLGLKLGNLLGCLSLVKNVSPLSNC